MPSGIYKRTEYHKMRRKETSCLGNKNPMWKGNDVGKVALHSWVRRWLGSPRYCEDCGSINKKMYHWANISGKYKRDFRDFKRLCAKCHCKFDYLIRPNGEKHGRAILNEEKVRQIRKLYSMGGVSYAQIAQKYNVDRQTIFRIVKIMIWKGAK